MERGEVQRGKKAKGRKDVFSAGRNATVLTETEALEAINYKPRHRESKKAYEEILSLIQQNIGDQPQVGGALAWPLGRGNTVGWAD